MITHVTERETALADEVRRLKGELELQRMKTYCAQISDIAMERDALKTLVANVHKAKGRYHSQLAMAVLYEACGLPFVKPVSGEKA